MGSSCPFMSRRVRLAGLVCAALALSGVPAQAAPAAPLALINASTVINGDASQEATVARGLGYTVTVVSDAQWAAMTAAEFGSYDMLIAGDPRCGSLPSGLVASAPVYGPVVLGTAGGRTFAGNRVVVGTDPVYHDGGDVSSARGAVIRSGIAFAGKQPGTTGMYFTASCDRGAGPVAVLDALSAGAGAWTMNTAAPCGGMVSLIASNPAFADLTTASLQGWSCSVHATFPTFKSDWSALAVATDAPSRPTCGVDPATGAEACGQAYILIAGSGIVVASGSIAVAPLDSTGPVGTDRTVTANVTSAGSPLENQLVSFSVTGPNSGASGTCAPLACTTDASGNVSFTYRGANGVGDDTVKASFTDARGSLQAATAQTHWVAVPDQPIAASPTTFGATAGVPFNGVRVATFTDADAGAAADGYAASIEWGDGSSSAGAISAADGGFYVTGDHVYIGAGTFAVVVTISDNDAAADRATANSTAIVTAVGASPAPPLAPAVTLDPANTASVDEGPATHRFRYAISHPSGTAIASVATDCGSAGSRTSESFTRTGGSFSCRFADGPAESIVRVSATDANGRQSNTDVQRATIRNVAPLVVISPATKLSLRAVAGTRSLRTAAARSFNYAIVDPGQDEVRSVRSSCGTGGTKVSERHTSTSGTLTCSYTHDLANPGVWVQASDSDGALGNTATLTMVRSSLRAFTIHLYAPRGSLRSAQVRVNGRQVPVRRQGGRLTALVDLRGTACNPVSVGVVARTTSGRVLRSTRRYLTCTPGRHLKVSSLHAYYH